MKKSYFFTVQDWMVQDLKLRGADLLVFAVIYGYTQGAQGIFNGTGHYIAYITGLSRPSVVRSLDMLVAKQYVQKNIIYKSNRKHYTEYTLGDFFVDEGNLQEIEKSTVKEPAKDNNSEIVQQIIQHLNNATGQHYKADNIKTKQLINTRLKEGYTLQDFFTVIDKKTRRWADNEKMRQFIRPETLFSNKFESYLNEIEQPGMVLNPDDDIMLKGYNDLVEYKKGDIL